MRSIVAFAALAAWRLNILVTADHDPIAGYTPVSDVVEHSELDLDMAELEAGADLETVAGFEEAWRAYAVGGNSEKTDEIRTIRGFSTSAQEKLTGEPWFDIYEDYWGEPAYADAFTAAACNGTGDFEGAAMVTRAECCLKGAQYQNVWMYVIHELEDAINDCNNGDLSANDGGPHAWDEGWAFYAGSLEDTDGSGDGQMVYALADKRCANFGTCTGDDDGSDFTGTSAVNADMLALYQEGVTLLLDGKCDDVIDIKNQIVDLMTIPLVQGVLRYLYLADPSGGMGDDKEAAELWAFSAAVLPRIHECDADVAAIVRANTDITSSDAPVADGHVAMKEQLEKVYGCLGFSCSDVGGLVVEGTTNYISGMEPCGDKDDSLSDGAIAGIAIVAAAVVAVIGLCIWRARRSKSTNTAGDTGLGGFGKGATSTL